MSKAQGQEAEEHCFRDVVENVVAGIAIMQDDRIVYANACAARMLGRDRNELIGVAPADLLVDEEKQRPAGSFAALAAGRTTEEYDEYRVPLNDGRMRYLAVSSTLTQWRGRPAHLGVFHDISRQRAAMAALRGSEERYRSMVEALGISESTNRALKDALVDGDIAERKRAAAELERHRDRLEELVHERTRELEAAVAARVASETFAQTMIDHQPTLLAYVDNARRIRFANRAWLAWFGKTREEVLGRDGRESIGEGMLQPDEDVIERVLRGEVMGTPTDMRDHDGRVGNFWIYRLPDIVDDQIRGYFFIASDITEMRRSERRLQELNAKLIQAESFTRGIADNLPGRVAYWDSEQRCRFANRVYCEWLGKSLDQVLGKTAGEIFGEDRAPERVDHALDALRGAPQKFESEETSADGHRGVWFVQYIPDIQRGEVRGYFVLASDITATKRAQADLELLNLELVAARDVAEDAAHAKSAFLANMSHEIRTPMNVIIGLTHLMLRDTHEPVTADRLAKVGDAAHHLLDIINDILDLSKIDAGKLVLAPVDFSVDALLARSTALVADGARRKGLALTVDRGELPQTLRGDALRLSQVLVNLLGNAVKFTARGIVTLRCDVMARDDSEWTIRFAVHDTGVGISPEAQERLFKPFEQADGSTTRRFGGTGLGLSIASELAQLMGGAIGVDSEPGCGSVFWFTAKLQAVGGRQPVAPTPHEVVASGRAAEQMLKQRHHGARVLIADDNIINQELATELLRLVDLQVEVADNGRVAFDMAQRGAYDLILMDMQMPEMDGLEATRRIRSVPALDATPIVAMTASAFGADRDACLAAGMNDHVGKPVNPAALYEILLRWLDQARAAPRAAAALAPAQAQAPPAPRATDALDRIEALDVARGLGLFAGQRALYVQALGYFVDLYGDGLASVEKFMAAQGGATREAVGREIHSMGGAAAALGAVDLENAARRIDALVRDERGRPGDDGELRAELAQLRTALGDLVARLREALGPHAQALT
jgi:PAS domain S-box-containing protein